MYKYTIIFLHKETRATNFLLWEIKTESENVIDAINKAALEMLSAPIVDIMPGTWEPIKIIREDCIETLKELEEVY